MTEASILKTKQEIFNKVAKHLINQGEAARVEELLNDTFVQVCVLKTPDGKKCAVGCLIPDEVYSPELEGESIYTIWEKIDLGSILNVPEEAKPPSNVLTLGTTGYS